MPYTSNKMAGLSKWTYGILFFAVIGLACWSYFANTGPSPAFQTKESARTVKEKIKPPNPDAQQEIPDYVYRILEHVNRHQEAPPGHVGGRGFQNREKRLPSVALNGESIRYREWDVHPKQPGKNRGPERLVTGSDQSAYYTADHYQTFIPIRP